jgi:hypothetical protein
LAKKDPFEHTFHQFKIVDEAGTQNKTFYMNYRISLPHNYHVEKSAVQMYISPSVFITVNET